MGNWISNESQLKHKATKFFITLYCKEASTGHVFIIRDSFPILNIDFVNALNSLVTREEIRAALFEMKPLKASGPNDLHAAFFSITRTLSVIRCVPWWQEFSKEVNWRLVRTKP